MTVSPVGPALAGTSEVEVDGRLHVYSPSTQQLVALNDTGSDVWRLCDGEHTAADIVELLASSYEVHADSIRADVHAVLDRLVAIGLLPAPAAG